MTTQDTCCTIVPYFTVPDEQIGTVREMCEQFVELTENEPKCLYYGFSFDGNDFHCREGYADADGLLAHIENVGSLLEELLKIVELTRLEVHGPEGELAKLRQPLAEFSPQFFTLEFGFRR